MIETQLNLFDAAVIGIMLLSCLFAFFRGFVREVLSLGAWIGAAIITIYYFPDMARILKPHFKSAMGAAGVGTLIIYSTSLIGFSIINAIILKYVKSGNEVGMLDNLMGLMFGAARGALIVSLGYFLMTIALPEKEYPQWLVESVTKPYAERGAITLAKVAPEYLREISTLQQKAAKEMRQARQKGPDIEIEDDKYGEDLHKGDEDTGYRRSTARQLDRLLDSTSSSPSR